MASRPHQESEKRRAIIMLALVFILAWLLVYSFMATMTGFATKAADLRVLAVNDFTAASARDVDGVKDDIVSLLAADDGLALALSPEGGNDAQLDLAWDAGQVPEDLDIASIYLVFDWHVNPLEETKDLVKDLTPEAARKQAEKEAKEKADQAEKERGPASDPPARGQGFTRMPDHIREKLDRDFGSPGQSGDAPGQGGTPPGQGGTPPGQSGDSPGNSGDAPGQSGDSPGNSGDSNAGGKGKGQGNLAGDEDIVSNTVSRLLSAINASTASVAETTAGFLVDPNPNIKFYLVEGEEETAIPACSQIIRSTSPTQATCELTKALNGRGELGEIKIKAVIRSDEPRVVYIDTTLLQVAYFLPDQNLLADVNYAKIDDDSTYEAVIDSAQLDESLTLTVVFHHDSPEPQPISIEGDVLYSLDKEVSSQGESVTLEILNWQEEYFRIHVGSHSEVFEFGQKKDVAIKPNVKDAKGNPVEVEAEFLDAISKERKGGKGKGEAQAELKQGKYDIRLKPSNHPVKELALNDVPVYTDIEELIDIDDTPESIKGPEGMVEVFAINPRIPSFTGWARATAQGTALFKCRDWDYASQTCHGFWQLVQALVPGQDYLIELSPEDPAYAETEMDCSAAACLNRDTPTTCTCAEIGANDGTYASALTPLTTKSDQNAMVHSTHTGISLPSGAAVDDVNVYVNWYVDNTEAGTLCRIWVYEADASLWHLASTTCRGGEVTDTFNVSSYIDSVNDAENVQVKVVYNKVGSAGAAFALHVDMIDVNVGYTYNNAPVVQVTRPNGGGTVSGEVYHVDWNVSDAEEADTLSFDIYYSASAGAQSNLVASGLSFATYCTDSDGNLATTNSCSYDWNTLGVDNGVYYLDINASDTEDTVLDSSDASFTVNNSPQDLSFVISYPSTGCTEGKGSLDAGSSCEKCYFEPSDLSGATDETQVACEGQSDSQPFFMFDNQSSSSTPLTWSMNLDSNLAAAMRFKVSTVYNGYESTCTGNPATGCVNVNTTTPVDIASNITVSGDKNAWGWADFVNAWPSDSTDINVVHTSSAS